MYCTGSDCILLAYSWIITTHISIVKSRLVLDVGISPLFKSTLKISKNRHERDSFTPGTQVFLSDKGSSSFLEGKNWLLS